MIPSADLIYIGTGNAGPWPEQLRKSKGKDNLYACSVLAVRPDTGELKWYFQMVPGDSWDYDSVQQLMLADLTIKGQQRKVLMQANKDGFYYVLDRVTGQFISGQPWVQVTWAKGLDEVTGRPIVNEEAHYGGETVMLTPGPGGGHNWSPMSFNPSTGLVYVPSSNGGVNAYTADENFVYKPGEKNLGIIRPKAQTATPETQPARPPRRRSSENQTFSAAIGPAPPEGQRNILVAWDPVTQKERWHAIWRRRLRWRHRLHGWESGLAGDSGRAAGRLSRRYGREAPGSQDRPARRHGSADHLSDRRQAVRLVDGRYGQSNPVCRTASASCYAPPSLPKLLTFVLDGASQ